MSDPVLLGYVTGSSSNTSSSITVSEDIDSYKYLIVAVYHVYANNIQASSVLPAGIYGAASLAMLSSDTPYDITAAFTSAKTLSINCPASNGHMYQARLYGVK